LRDVPVKDIHGWEKKWSDYEGIYVKPIVDYAERREKAMGVY